MIIDAEALPESAHVQADVAVVGAGPAGIVTALELSRRGLDVVIIETGDEAFDPAKQDLSAAADLDPDVHAPVELAVRRQIGGTSTIWGGRCVPYDPIDFAVRPFVPDSHWPVQYADIAPYFARACEWIRCGRPIFSSHEIPELPASIVPGLDDGPVTVTSLERWSLPTNVGKEYFRELKSSAQIRVLTGLTATQLVTRGEHVESIDCRTSTHKKVTVSARSFVIACGGLESTRLLLHSAASDGGVLGDHSGHLGRWYMAHLEGVIANVELSTPPKSTIYGYERDIDGTYIRRRFAFTAPYQLEHALPNIAGWFTNPEIPDAAHGDPDLSFVYLMLSSRLGPRFSADAQRLSLTGTRIPGTPYGVTDISPRREHVSNLLNHPVKTAEFIAKFGSGRFLTRGRRVPGFFAYSPKNIYPFQYHGEHLPARDSRVSLSDEVDQVGMRRLQIDLRFTDADIDGVVRAHTHWDEHLQRMGVGRFRYLHTDLHEAVRSRSGGGFHQVGTTRMASTAADGVVDRQLRVYGVDNAYVASSSVFVSSGQANSTFMILAFAVRLADHLAQRAAG